MFLQEVIRLSRFLVCIAIHNMIWSGFTFILYVSTEDRFIAKVFLFLILLYLVYLISLLIGKTKAFASMTMLVSLGIFYLGKTCFYVMSRLFSCC